jgi:hypothetical protein
MSAFTDEDLKRLKARRTYRRGDGTGCFIRTDQISALLARLECAEACIKSADLSETGKLSAQAFNEWKKSKGK